MKNFLEKSFSKYFLKIKEAIPQHKAKTCVGLDIGTSSVKLVRIVNSVGSHEIDSYAIEAIKQNEVKEAVSKALEKAKISSKLVNTSVSGQGVIIRYVLLPKMPLADIKSSISLEADKYFPFPIDDVNMDCFILEERPAENKLFVLVVAAKKDLIEQRIALLSSLDLEPEIICTDSIAVANIFHVLAGKEKSSVAPSAPDKSQAIAVLNIGATSSNLNIIKDNLPRFTRDIFMGGNDFTKRITNTCSLDLKSAEELKINPKDQKEKILQACESVLGSLVAEIRLSFDYFESENNIPVSLLYLSGGGACLSGLEEILTQNLSIEAKPWQPISGLSVNSMLSQEDLINHANKLSVAIGTALN